jgi:nucleoid DNA-binding protein
MKKTELFKHLQLVAEKATIRKRLNGIHIKAITEELLNVWTNSLRERGSASFFHFGRFDVDKKTGKIKFTASSILEEKVFGDVSLSNDKDDKDESTR